MSNSPLELFWDSTYAIALTLIDRHPAVRPDDVGLYQLADMIEALPEFADDPALVTERILQDILIVWYEETSHL